MRIHRFYINTPIKGDTLDISDKDLVHQWKNVFRYNVGSQVILFDGFGVDYLCLISSIRNMGATVSVVREIKNKFEPKKDIWLCMAVIKKDNFNLIVEKATEIGVNHLVPILCERSEKKNLNIERLRKIAKEASEQSGRGNLPEIHEIISFQDLLDSDILPNGAIFLNLEGEVLDTLKYEGSLSIFIGPEGGWSEKEIKEFKKYNIPAVSLGKQILRAETAAISASSLFLL